MEMREIISVTLMSEKCHDEAKGKYEYGKFVALVT